MHTPVPSTARRRSAIGALAAAGLGVATGPARSQARQPHRAGHVVLFGDSSFDNKAYVGGQPDVLTHLRRQLPHPWRATLAAVDGAVAGDVRGRLARVPADATHLVISAGGQRRAPAGRRVRGSRAKRWRGGSQACGGARALRAGLWRHARRGPRAGAAHGTLHRLRPAPHGPAAPKAGRDGPGAVQRRHHPGRVRPGPARLDLRLICDEDADFANPIEGVVRLMWAGLTEAT